MLKKLRPFLLFFLLMLVFIQIGGRLGNESRITRTDYKSFMTMVEHGNFQKVAVDEDQRSLVGETNEKPPKVFESNYIGDGNMAESIRTLSGNSHVLVEARSPQKNSFYAILLGMLPTIFFALLLLYFLKQLGNGQNKAMSFGKSKAKLVTEQKRKVTFADVILDDEVKESVMDIVDYLKDPRKFQRLGGVMPKEVLFIGPPGCGKTELARAMAGEAGVPFSAISGSDFVEMFVGVGASRVRDLFDQSRKNTPCVVFIDEIDAVGRHRGAGVGGGHDEREQTLNQLLVEMDGFEDRSGVILIAATNRPDVLDPALLRRFTRQVVVPKPDIRARKAIAIVHAKDKIVDPSIDWDSFAKLTAGASGDDIMKVVNEAALIGAKDGSDGITNSHLNEAYEKKIMGGRRGLKMRERVRRATAFHEAGHTWVRLKHPGSSPLHKVTIIPRGRALGVTMSVHDEDLVSMTSDEMFDEIRVMFGGRAAEKHFFNAITTGASNDIEQATNMAKSMVRKYGMDPNLGPVCYDEPETQVFLGRDLGSRKQTSEATEREIDEAVRAMLKEQDKYVLELIQKDHEQVTIIAEALLERETLDKDEVLALPGVAMALSPNTTSFEE